MAEKTAVDWLFEQIPVEWTSTRYAYDAYQQAKQMEKGQQIFAYSTGWHDGQDAIINRIKHIDKGGDEAGEQYYNETFGK